MTKLPCGKVTGNPIVMQQVQRKLAYVSVQYPLCGIKQKTAMNWSNVQLSSSGTVETEVSPHLFNGCHIPMLVRYGIGILLPLIAWVLFTPKQSAQTAIYCAITSELDEVSGKYFASCTLE